VRPSIPYTLCVAASVLGGVASSTAAAQAGATTKGACSLFDANELKRITGKKDLLGRGPEQSDPSETPKDVSECEFLGYGIYLKSPATPAVFEQERAAHEKAGRKVQPVPGTGDAAYYWWDPRPGAGIRGVGLNYRVGSSRVIVMDQVSPDSIEAAKPVLLKIANATMARVR
jgi:hypothetical protein